jgi:hypothetical protein
MPVDMNSMVNCPNGALPGLSKQKQWLESERQMAIQYHDSALKESELSTSNTCSQ